MGRTTEEKLNILNFIQDKGRKKAMVKYGNLSNSQIRCYMKNKESYKKIIKEGIMKDNEINNKRKGREWHASEK